MDTLLILGDFIFDNLEIPPQINFGGDQVLVTHKLVGGERVIDAMGKDDANITWSGLMLGNLSLVRAKQLNDMRVAGQPVDFSCFNLRYKVLIENFTFNTERWYQVNYSITLKVLEDNSQPPQLLSILGFDDAIINDLNIANQLVGLLNIPELTNAMNTLTSLINSIPTFNNASTSTVSGVLSTVNSTQFVVQQQIQIIQQRLFG